MNKASSLIPQSLKAFLLQLRNLKNETLAFRYFGTGRFCPVCEKESSRFRPFGLVVREEAQCVHCKSLERHRFMWLYFQTKTDLFDGQPKQMLHIAPEPCFAPRLAERLGQNYLTADLFSPNVMIKMDITDIQYGDKSFDVIYCSHVLEHVPDDHRALSEFYRTLKNDGWAIINVPIEGEKTREDLSITDPAERLKRYGQEDHVRIYGADYIDRLRAAGFKVEMLKVSDIVNDAEVVKMGLTSASGEIFYCTKG